MSLSPLWQPDAIVGLLGGVTESKGRRKHMQARFGAIAGCLLLAGLAGCDKMPAGKADVAARVYGEKITVPELDAELKAAEVPNSNDPRVRQEALQRIILRKLLAKAAHDQKLDRDPSFPILKKATVESFEAGQVQRAAVQKVAAPTLPESSNFVNAHPEMFAQRTVYLVDELLVGQPPDQALVDALRPLNDFDAIEKLLQDRRVAYRRGQDQLDSLRLDPNLSLQIARLPAGAPFVLPAPNGLVIARVRASKTEPVVGEQALTIASSILSAQRKQKAVNDTIQSVMTAAKASIVYGPGYAPPQAPPAKK
jgi:EpsD family peptidyl-prolyl cis-trans isomerase